MCISTQAPRNKPQRGRETAPNKKETEGKAISERKETPQDRYLKAHATSVCFRVMHNTEADILKKLSSVENKAGYIKGLIRADIAKGKN